LYGNYEFLPILRRVLVRHTAEQHFVPSQAGNKFSKIGINAKETTEIPDPTRYMQWVQVMLNEITHNTPLLLNCYLEVKLQLKPLIRNGNNKHNHFRCV